MKLLGLFLFLAASAPAALVSAHVRSDLRARSGSYGHVRIGVAMGSAGHHRRHHARSMAQSLAELVPRAEDDCEEEDDVQANVATEDGECEEEEENNVQANLATDNGECDEEEEDVQADLAADDGDCEESIVSTDDTATSTSTSISSTSTSTSTSNKTRTTSSSSSSRTKTRQSSSTSSSSSAQPTRTGGGGSSGKATFFFQSGGIGACGIGDSPLPDTDKVVALCPSQFRSACGKQIEITNTLTGKTTTARGNDVCPSCDCNHLDLSLGAWDALGSDRSLGVIDISFKIL